MISIMAMLILVVLLVILMLILTSAKLKQEEWKGDIREEDITIDASIGVNGANININIDGNIIIVYFMEFLPILPLSSSIQSKYCCYC